MVRTVRSPVYCHGYLFRSTFDLDFARSALAYSGSLQAFEQFGEMSFYGVYRHIQLFGNLFVGFEFSRPHRSGVLASGYSRSPGPLEIMTAQVARHIQYFTDEKKPWLVVC